MFMLVRLGLIAVCAVLTVCVSAPGRTYFVDPGGSDRNKGTAEQPLRTISRGAELAQPGDTVLVKAGVYRERVAPPRGGRPGAPITYQGAPGERVFVRGSELWTPDWRDEGGGVFSATPDESLFDDRSSEYVDSYNPLKVELSSTPWGRQGRREVERMRAGEGRIGGGDERIVYTCGQVFVDGEEYREVPLREEIEPKTWFYEPKTERVYVHFGEGKAADHEVELTTRRRIFAPKTRGLGHIIVEGFVFEHAGNQYPTNFWSEDKWAQKGAVGIEVGHHWTIRRNVIRHCKTFALDAGSVDRHSGKHDAHDNLIEENYILDNGSGGVLSNGSRNLVIRRNVMLRNNHLRFDGIKRWEQAAIKTHQFLNGLIEENYLADNYKTYGVWLDNQFPDSRVSRNVIHNNGSAGIFLEMSDYGFDRLLVDNNLVFDNKQNSVYIHDASGATFVHNLLANAVEARGYGHGVMIHQVMARTKTYHHSFYNNLIIGNAKNVEVNYPADRSGPQRFDRNLYGVEPKSRAFVVNRKSDKPSPYSSDEFEKMVTSDIGLPPPNAKRFADPGKAALTLGEWRSFWEHHDCPGDEHSVLDPASEVHYDRDSYTLSVYVEADPSGIGSVDREEVTRDYFGKPLPGNGTSKPGPFQDLRRGRNRFVIWNGLPRVEEGELPPVDWTVSE